MKISYNWLKELVDFDWTPEQLADKLTMSGLETESILPMVEGLDKIVVGKVEKTEKHPSSDKLSVCLVNVGSKKLQIVCGAPNVQTGQFVPVALVGAILPDGMQIKSDEIKKVKSEGMLCSEKELGLGEEKDGIMVLENGLQAGISLKTALGLDDWILDVDLTPNRPDCLSMLGIAREISALTGSPIRKPKIEIIESSEQISSYVRIEIEDKIACPRYTARIVKSVNIAPSPFWLKRKLLAVGIRPINNVVDIGNLVMMELGHPLHAFDYALFSTKKIAVKKAKENERFITLDGVERKLNQDVLLITDGKNGVAIAGIMGGMESEISSYTKDVLIESAYFDPRTIRRGRMKLGISTESSYRFERGADPNITEMAVNRAASLIKQIAGGEILKGVADTYPNPIIPLKLDLRPKRVNQILSISLSAQEMSKILNSLDLKTKDKGNSLEVEAPTFRPDLTREIDLIEEIARIYGYDKIGIASNAGGSLLTEIIVEEKLQRKVKNLLIGKGFFEIVTNNLVHPKLLNKINPEYEPLALRNPLSEEMSVLATSLAYGMLSIIAHNKNHKQNDLKLFELGKIILPKEKDKLPLEKQSLCLALSGKRKPMQWGESHKDEVDFFDLKGIIEEIFESIGVAKLEVSPNKKSLFEPDCSLSFLANRELIGFCGEISKEILDDFDIKDKVFLAELDFELLAKLTPFEISYVALPKFPDSKRDLAILVDQDVLSQEVEKTIREVGKELVDEVALFDVYQGKQIPKEKKSLAYSISYRLPERTLTDKEIETAHQNIINQLKKEFKAELRQ